MKTPEIQKHIDALREKHGIEQLIANIESEAKKLWASSEDGSEAQKSAKLIFCLINALLDHRHAEQKVPMMVFNEKRNGLIHEPTGNEIRFHADNWGYCVSYYENSEIIACSNGIGLEDLAKEVAQWVRCGYKA